MANKKLGKVINVCVVGLSGYDIKEKCLYAVGKSCFCNRFVRPKEDEYYQGHASFFSTSDFVGSVLNNDHFIYWGSVEKTLDENTTMTFKVIEQTELIDDASYAPLSKSGQLIPYVKRATVTKLQSPGKMMYISRDQVALESDYEKVQMDRDGKIQIDAFICIYDVSKTLAERVNNTEIQEELLSRLLSSISKTKKPVVVVATKCDESSEEILQRAHNFVQNKKLSAPLVESSAECHVNVDLGFQALVHLVDTKSRYRAKFVNFNEGLLVRKEFLTKLDEKYLSLVKSTATDSALLMSWGDFKKSYSEEEAFTQYISSCGMPKARQKFNEQAKKIRRHYEDKKLNEFLNKLPDALDELLPSLQSIEWNWENCQQAIKNHILFDKWFHVLPNGEKWNSPERLFTTTNNRIPFDVLQVERSRACFDRHIKKLKESALKAHMKNEFRKLLELTLKIQPGTNWLDASQLISHEESYKYLDENTRKMLFETYLRDITLRAKLDFQELLFESASRFSKLSKDSRPSPEEMKNIYSYLQDDIRYKRLENVGNARDILLFNHMALMQSPNRCLSGPEKCMDRLMQQVVEMTARTTAHNPYENEIFRDSEDELINLLVLGKDGLGEELEEKIKIESSSYDSIEVIVDGQIYELNIKVYNKSEEDLAQVIADFKPQGYLAIYSKADSFDFVDTCLKKIQEYESINHMSLPLIVLLANETGRDDEIQMLRNRGQNLANTMECSFVDYPYTVSLMDDRIHDSQVHDAIRGIVDVINRRARPASTPTGGCEAVADIRILLCAMCGDEYPVELILGTMLQHNTCYSNPEKQDTIMLEAVLGGARKTISVTLGSYHRAYSLKDKMFHGCILVYSATRLASLETLRAYASTLYQEVPMQVLAVTGSASGASIIFHEENAMLLLTEGSNVASKLSAKLQQTPQNQAGKFLTFFNNVYDKRRDTELILKGIKRRRQEPLPKVPTRFGEADPVTNGDIENGMYASISETGVPDSPYVEVALRHSFIMNHIESDSSPSSPDRNHILRDDRSRASTVDSHDDDGVINVDHDESGLYAKVNKKFTYIKKVEKRFSFEEDDDDLVWQENLAYDAAQGGEPTRVSVSSNLDSPRISDRPYATVPFLPKGHKPILHDFEKFATLPAESSKKGWYEPDYASIEQIKSQINSNKDQGYEADSLSSVSSKSKESAGSQLELRDLKPSSQSKVPLNSPGSTSSLQMMWQYPDKAEEKPVAPLAKKDDDENDEIKELREKLSETLIVDTPRSKSVSPRKFGDQNKDKKSRKGRSESNNSTSSLEVRNQSFIKKLMNKVSPNPSPINSDVDLDQSEVVVESPRKKRRSKRLKQNPTSTSTPTVVVNEADASGKDRSNTLPVIDSPKHAPKFASLDGKKKLKLPSFMKNVPEINLTVSTPAEQEKYHTLDLRKNKNNKIEKPTKETRDDLYLSIGGSGEKRKPQKKKPSLRFPKGSRPNKTRKRDSDISNKVNDWQQKKLKNQKFKSSNYFGRPLKDICPVNSACPLFVKSVISHVEANGMQSEGIYRLSGKKPDIDVIMEKFEANNNISLQELGVSVHAITGALKNFFKLLPDPLIPYEFGCKINDIMILMDAAERLKRLRSLVNSLPSANLEVFKMFMSHLKRITEYKTVNKMDVRNLQTVLYPTLLRPNFDSLQNMSQNMNMGLFIQTCIEQSEHIFEVSEEDEHTNMKDTSEQIDGDNQDDGGALDINTDMSDLLPTSTSPELSFSESVLMDPGMENLINLRPPVDINFESSMEVESKLEKRKSVETAI